MCGDWINLDLGPDKKLGTGHVTSLVGAETSALSERRLPGRDCKLASDTEISPVADL